MKTKNIQHTDVRGKKVLVRVDFNVSVDDNGDAKSLYKIAAARETVDFLVRGGASHIALLTHFGRPEEAENPDAFSLTCLRDDVERVLERPVEFVPDCAGEKVAAAVAGYAEGKIMLLENVRFYKGEKENDKRFAAELAQPFDLYVNDAFAVCHRKHTSVHAITTCLPSYAGMWLQKEIMHLDKIKNPTEHPAVAIIGGAKIETKLPLITALCKTYDTVLVGGKSSVEAQQQNMSFCDKVVLPTDFEDRFFDIGPQTIAQFVDYITNAKMIVWNGPMGFIEEQYVAGTQALIDAITQNRTCFSVVGGGESVQMIEQSGALHKISFVSTGGGAMLMYLCGEDMPGIAVLRV